MLQPGEYTVTKIDDVKSSYGDATSQGADKDTVLTLKGGMKLGAVDSEKDDGTSESRPSTEPIAPTKFGVSVPTEEEPETKEPEPVAPPPIAPTAGETDDGPEPTEEPILAAETDAPKVEPSSKPVW